MDEHSVSSDDDDQIEPEGMENDSSSSEDDDQIGLECMEDNFGLFEDDDQTEPEDIKDDSELSEDDGQTEPEGMEDDSELSEDDSELSEEEEKIEPAEQIIISYYLNMMINNNRKESWPFRFLRDIMMYHVNPWLESPKFNYFVFVKRRTEACGRTDVCGSGCWRIMARDKVIKTEETGRILGFKKILKFCEKEKERPEKQEEQETWVMEEYRLVDKWKQDHAICRIRLLNQLEVSALLAKHFSFLSKWMPADRIISCYLKMLVDNRNDWPSHFLQSEQVYGVVPWGIMDVRQSSVELYEGRYFFVNRRENSGRTDGCDGGCWRIMRRDKVITSKTNEFLGFKRIFKFCEKVPQPVYKFLADEKFEENEIKLTWIMEEYRLAKKEQGEVICRIRLLFPSQLKHHIQDF